MEEYFDICGTHISLSSIKDFRIIDVEFVFRPVYREVRKTVVNALINKRYEFDSMQPYAAIVGQQGQKSALGEYKAKDFKEALGKDLMGAVTYTIGEKFKIKALNRQKYQLLNLAGRAFTSYLDDIPAVLKWNDGRIAEVYKDDPLYGMLGENTTPGVQYIHALIIKTTSEVFSFYGNDIQIGDAYHEYSRLQTLMEENTRLNKNKKAIGLLNKINIPKIEFSITKSAENHEEDEDLAD